MSERPHGLTEGHRRYVNGPSQKKVFDMMITGHSKAQAAQTIGIAPGRVRGHISTIKRAARRDGYDPDTGA